MKKLIVLLLLVLAVCGPSFGRGTPVKPTSETNDAVSLQYFLDNAFRSGAATGSVDFNGQAVTNLGGALGTGNTEGYHIVSGVIRYYEPKPNGGGNGWDLLENQNEGHHSIGIKSVTNDTSKIYIYYADNITNSQGGPVTFIVCPDETLAGAGITCGASVGPNDARIQLFTQGVSDYIYYDGAAWVSFGGYYTTAWTNNALRVEPVSSPHLLQRSPLDGYYPKYGSTPSIETRGGGYNVTIKTHQSTYTDIEFYDYAGTLITTEDTSMKFYINSPSEFLNLNPGSGGDFSDKLGNLWIFAIFKNSSI